MNVEKPNIISIIMLYLQSVLKPVTGVVIMGLANRSVNNAHHTISLTNSNVGVSNIHVCKKS